MLAAVGREMHSWSSIQPGKYSVCRSARAPRHSNGRRKTEEEEKNGARRHEFELGGRKQAKQRGEHTAAGRTSRGRGRRGEKADTKSGEREIEGVSTQAIHNAGHGVACHGHKGGGSAGSPQLTTLRRKANRGPKRRREKKNIKHKIQSNHKEAGTILPCTFADDQSPTSFQGRPEWLLMSWTDHPPSKERYEKGESSLSKFPLCMRSELSMGSATHRPKERRNSIRKQTQRGACRRTEIKHATDRRERASETRPTVCQTGPCPGATRTVHG